MIRIGVLGCAEIAFRRFLPELVKNQDFSCVAIAEEYDRTKLQVFQDTFGITPRESFADIIQDPEIDAVYIPLPPAFHYMYAKQALEAGKHVFVEKPSTTNYNNTKELAELAQSRNLVLQENYMFQYHSQIAEIWKMLADGKIGDIRLIRTSFGFPLRQANDFRYSKALGGGALLDAGGYVTKLATLLLGETIEVRMAMLNHMEGYDVDMYGAVTFENAAGLTCQASFSMDNFYQCSLEVIGNKGRLYTNRVYTAPPALEPDVLIETADGSEHIKLSADSHFAHSIEQFAKAVEDETVRKKMARDLVLQAKLVQEIRELGSRQ